MNRTPHPAVLALAGAVAVSVTAAAAPALTSASALAAPTISVQPVVSVDFPRQVPPATTGQAVVISFTVSSSEPVDNVTAHAYSEDGGLVVGNATQSLGTLSAPRTVSFPVSGATPGLHELFLDVVGPSVSGYGSVPFVWTSGSPLFPGKDELDPMTFGWQGTTHGPGGVMRAVRMLTILPGGWAYTGLPAKGTPRCRSEGGGCHRYAYDEESDVLQVGTGIIGALYGEENPPGLYTEGLAAPDPQAGQLYGVTDVTGPSRYADKTTTLLGTYAFSTNAAPGGLGLEKVTFRPGGTYKLTYSVNGRKVKKLKGAYKLRNRGKITFRSKAGKVVQRGTVLVLEETSPEHGRFRPGIWLILSGKKGKTPDGNLLLKK